MAEFEKNALELSNLITPFPVPDVMALPSGPIAQRTESSLSPKIASRLEVFQHIVKEVSTQEQNIAANDKRVFGKVNKEGKITEKYFDMDNRFLHIWNHVAFNLYQELEKNPEAKEAALETLAELKKVEGDVMTPGQLVELFNRE